MSEMWSSHRICARRRWYTGFSRARTADEYNHRCNEMASNLDTWLAFFKGELSLYDIREGMSFKRLMELIEARSKRMLAEQEELRKSQNAR